mmetsp:Transcript_57520/g.114210  ORF Transcript_57520/g.114210 Transcript_57520/m.114210 type:complete len:116 (-) Transcript_57520:16-363(-)
MDMSIPLEPRPPARHLNDQQLIPVSAEVIGQAGRFCTCCAPVDRDLIPVIRVLVDRGTQAQSLEHRTRKIIRSQRGGLTVCTSKVPCDIKLSAANRHLKQSLGSPPLWWSGKIQH